MTKPELITAIQQAGLIPVPIRDETEEMEELALPSFDGNLTQFLATAKALETKAVLVCSYTFDEADFIHVTDEEVDDDYLDDDEDEEEDDEETEETDLTERFPSLIPYKKNLGQECIFSLTAVGGTLELNLELVEDWYLKFEQDLEKAQAEEA